jgi:ribonuclease HI
MTYQFPETLAALRAELVNHGMDVTAFKSDRQAAFMIQQLLGTRFKFPPKGQSCFPVLQRLETAVLTGNASSKKAVPARNGFASADDGAISGNPQMRLPAKRGKPSRPKSRRPVIGSATGFDAGLVIFCDGACEPNPGAGGWAFVVYRDGVEIHSEHGGDLHATNNTMELTGALMALRWFADRAVVEPVRLLCDSQYVVKGCNDWRHGWKRKGWRRGVEKELANAYLWRDLDEALTLVPITLEWAKGHIGTLGNERADELAALGRETLLVPVADIVEEQLRYAV